MKNPRFYTPQPLTENSVIELDNDAAHHAIKVLRMRSGEELVLFNGIGGEYFCSIEEADKRKVSVRIGKFNDAERESALNTHLAIALSKGDRFETVLQKATELGVTSITPLFTERTEVRLSGERLEKKMTSWKKIITGACEQSQRNHIPLLQPPATLEELLSSESSDLKLLLHHHSAQSLGERPAPQSLCLLVGPEGGFSEHEAGIARDAGFEAIALGPRVLRTETAPLAALAVLQFHWGDMA